MLGEAPKTGVGFPKTGDGKDELVAPAAENENTEDPVEAPVLFEDPNMVGGVVAEGTDGVEDAPKENGDEEPKADDWGDCQAVDPKTLAEGPLVELATAEPRPKLGAGPKLEPNTLVVGLLVELPVLISDEVTAEPRPKLGAEEPKRELPEVVGGGVAVVPETREVVEEPNLKGTACVTGLDACVLAGNPA